MNTVFGFGRVPSRVMVIGEMPGRQEFEKQRPFIGRSGEELKWYLHRVNLNLDDFYLTNICKEYIEYNPDPTSDQIEYWTPTLLDEIIKCNPQLIVAIGRYSAQFFLGDDITLEECHGLPHKATTINRLALPDNCIILPCYHPAFTFYGEPKKRNEAKILCTYDYEQVSKILKKINKREEIDFRVDEYTGRERYFDVTGKELEFACKCRKSISEVAIDTEGTPDGPWSIQVCFEPGTAYVLRYSQPDFNIGIQALQELADNDCLFVMHCASTPQGTMYDIIMSRVMGLELSRARIWDTMYALYLLRFEPRGLKPAAYRFCGMRLEPYMDLIGNIGKKKQELYLSEVMSYDWPRVEPRIKHSNDGTSRLTTPRHISRLAESILKDMWSGKVNKDGIETDPYKRWQKVDIVQRKLVEKELGKMPEVGTLDDIELSQAIHYSSRDADATLRLKYKLVNRLEELDLSDKIDKSTSILPVFEEIQYNGMQASKSKFEDLYDYLDVKISEMTSNLSIQYFGGKPFNPKSNPQTRSLLLRRGLKSDKKTKTGVMSTDKKSIEHYRWKDPAIELLFDIREYQHVRDSFCKVFLNEYPDDNYTEDIYTVHTHVNPAKTETCRPATEDPNLLNVPVHTEVGRKIRECFVCKEDEVMLGCDYNQIEMRVLAHRSNSKFLVQKFLRGEDIHSQTALAVFGVREEDLEGDGKFKYRIPAKRTNFGIVYGEEDYGLWEQLRKLGLEDWPLDRVSEFRREVLDLLGIEEYTERIIREAKYINGDIRRGYKGYIRDASGMYRYLPNLYADEPDKIKRLNFKERKEAYKLAAEAGRHVVSHDIQGTAQVIIQNTMYHLRNIIHDMQSIKVYVKWLLQVYDELIFLSNDNSVELVKQVVIDSMVNHCGMKLRVPIVAEAHIGRTWSELK